MSELPLTAHKMVSQRLLWGLLGVAGALIHLGIALLRLSTFFPYPKLTDFAAFYAGAWAIRLGVSSYEWPPTFLESLQAKAGLPPHPPIPYNPPVWLWLLQPLTLFSFPVAAAVWVLLVFVFLGWSAMALAQLVGYQEWKHRGIAFLLVLTFGPTFLDLTLGRNSFFLLTTVLVIGVDDQSLVAWLDRLGRPHTFGVPGLAVTQQHTVTWAPLWSVDPQVIRLGGYSIMALLGLVPIIILLRADPAEAEGSFYLWVPYGLIAFPHMERYNHVLLLPAMAWLWARSETSAQWGGNLVILAYFLVGLSRLTYLWAILLPAPWGPLASSFGLYAVLLLGGGMVTLLTEAAPCSTIKNEI